jgi:hypothetical protein
MSKKPWGYKFSQSSEKAGQTLHIACLASSKYNHAHSEKLLLTTPG